MSIYLNSLSGIQVSGNNAETFLQGQLTCDMRLLKNHEACTLAACCDHKGRMLANFWVMRWHQDFLLILSCDLKNTVIDHLQKYAVFSKVQVTSCPAHLAIIGCNNKTPSEKIRVIETHEVHDSQDETLWYLQNIRDGVCVLSEKTSLLFIPQMIHLEKLGGVSFEKGCYVGQEIVARTQYLGKLKRHLHHVIIPSNQFIQPGDDFKNQSGEKIGVIVNAVASQPGSYEALAVIQDTIY